MESTILSDNSQRAANVLLIMKISIGFLALTSLVIIYCILNNEVYWALNFPAISITLVFSSLILSLLSTILFIQWFRRAYHNLHKAGVKNLITTEGWAAGAWFVPLLNLVRPYEIMKEIWIETQQMYTSKKNDKNTIVSSTSLVNKWWTFFLISRFSSSFASFSPNNYFDLLTHILTLGAAYYTYQLVKDSSKHQELFLTQKNILSFGEIEKDENFE